MGKIVEQWAAAYQGGTSDKVWAGAYTDDGIFLSTWGRRGSNLQQGVKPLGSVAAASKEYQKKVGEKKSEGYTQVGFNDSYYQVRSFDPTLVAAAPKPAATPAPAPLYLTSHVTACDERALKQYLEMPSYGLSEKVNGERTVLSYDGKTLKAFNRKGQPCATVPSGAQPLVYLGCPFVIDGERMGADTFVAFDLMEWDGKDVKAQPFSQRIATLETAMQQHNLIPYASSVYGDVPCVGQFPTGVKLLGVECDSERKRELFAYLQDTNREGVILRQLDAPYEVGDTKYSRKFKFLADIDVIVTGFRPGIATGSVNTGLVRKSDGYLIDTGSVRSGLRDKDIEMLAKLIEAGQFPVLKVTYLPIRTTGVKLVEPRTSIKELRTDKTAAECTTDQLGEDKAAMIAAEVGRPFLDAAGQIIQLRGQRETLWD
ncbi:MAG TPA: WGR domain-containing protein [Aggregatilineales bacterium]|nr:WGR domain-containing protein [Aggregatilineales bacterium]